MNQNIPSRLANSGGAAGPIAVSGDASDRFYQYPGGKGGAGVWQRIINEMPFHTLYCECFVGSGRVLLNKLPAASTIAIDSDAEAIENVTRRWPEKSPAFTAICGDGVQWLQQFPFVGTELVYADPPYLREVRSCQKDLYRHEFADPEQHKILLETLMAVKAKVILSGYWSQLYADTLKGWRTVTIPTVNRRGKKVTEWLWCNFDPPDRLHDSRYLGDNFRVREKINRQKKRWIARLQRMDSKQRQALVEAMRAAGIAFSGD